MIAAETRGLEENSEAWNKARNSAPEYIKSTKDFERATGRVQEQVDELKGLGTGFVSLGDKTKGFFKDLGRSLLNAFAFAAIMKLIAHVYEYVIKYQEAQEKKLQELQAE